LALEFDGTPSIEICYLESECCIYEASCEDGQLHTRQDCWTDCSEVEHPAGYWREACFDVLESGEAEGQECSFEGFCSEYDSCCETNLYCDGGQYFASEWC